MILTLLCWVVAGVVVVVLMLSRLSSVALNRMEKLLFKLLLDLGRARRKELDFDYFFA